jgi:ABC-type transport system involved in cytochrome bd biosynthesis fused ATPase/permease subunit
VNVFRSIADGRDQLARPRAGVLFARLSSDLDALDSLNIRFATPLSAAAVILAGFAIILWGVSPLLTVATVTPVLLGGVLAPCLIGVFATRDARRRMLVLDAARTRLADLDRGRTELCIAGAFAAQAKVAAAACKLAAETEFRLIQLDAGLRLAGSLASQGAILGALLSGSALVGSHNMTPLMFAVIVVFSFSLGEVVAPLRLAALDVGRWTLAGRRLQPLLGHPNATMDKPAISLRILSAASNSKMSPSPSQEKMSPRQRHFAAGRAGRDSGTRWAEWRRQVDHSGPRCGPAHAGLWGCYARRRPPHPAGTGGIWRAYRLSPAANRIVPWFDRR